MTKHLFIAIGFALISGVAVAGTCKLQITRTACAGQEVAAFKPYGGKETTEETHDMKDAAACEAEAKKTSKIIRKGTLMAKLVKAEFDGKSMGPFEDKVDAATCKK